MPKIVKVIEILSESPKSWEEAAQNVVAEASKTLRNIRSTFRLSSRFSAGLRPRVDRGAPASGLAGARHSMCFCSSERVIACRGNLGNDSSLSRM